MSEHTYYEILEITQEATTEEIIAAKNRLAKKYHPDVNLKFGIDTTDKMQEILEAYRVLSDRSSRSEYDETLSGSSLAKLQMFDLKEESKSTDTASEDKSSFLYYWKTASRLQNVLDDADLYYHHASRKHSKLYQLAIEASECEQILTRGNIPQDVWTDKAMNWLVLRWYQNRNYTPEYLIRLYHEHLKKDCSLKEKRLAKKRLKIMQKRLKKLSAY